MNKILFFVFALWCVACTAEVVEDQDEISTVEQASVGQKLPTCKIEPKDETPLPNVCEGKMTVQVGQFSDEHLQDILIAMGRWNQEIGSQYFSLEVTQEERAACTIIAAPRPDRVYATWKKEQNMLVDVDKIQQSHHDFSIIIQHELGHSIGMRHRQNGIMCSAPWPTSEFEETDITQCRELSVCK